MSINKELLRETLQDIKGNPKHWNQRQWHCGSSHCFAGFVECKLRKHAIEEKTPVSWSIENKQMLIDVLYANNLGDPERIEKLAELYPNFGNHRLLPQVALGLNTGQAMKLFSIHNTLEDLERIVEELCAQDQESNVI
jgi:hypothetical protein